MIQSLHSFSDGHPWGYSKEMSPYAVVERKGRRVTENKLLGRLLYYQSHHNKNVSFRLIYLLLLM